MTTTSSRPGDPGIRRLVGVLSLATFLQWAGASAILPMLPLYLRRQGSSDALVGAVMGAFFLAGVAFQYPAGRLADRIGRTRVLLGGLVAYAVASVGFLAPWGPGADVALRALQGVGAGAAEVAALALVAAAVPLATRGAAFGRIYGALVAGLAVGPLIGSLVGAAHMNLVFVAAAATSLLATFPVLRAQRLCPESATSEHQLDPDHGAEDRGTWRNPMVAGALLAAAVIGVTTGVYEACWSLLLHTRDASNWQIGLSWTLFAVPFVAMARPAGWLADHLDRRVVAVAALGSSALFCAIYPWLHSLWIILGLGTLEAVGAAAAYPSVQSLLTQSVPAARAGHAQGLFASSQTAATGAAAAAGGALFALAPWAPFMATAAAAAGLISCIPWLWRKVGGRVPAAGSTLEVAHSGGQVLELLAPAGGLRQGSHHEFREAHGDELLELDPQPVQTPRHDLVE